MTQNVTKQQALREMKAMMEEARHYADLHDINFIALYETEVGEKSSVHWNCSQRFMAETALMLYNDLVPETQEAFIEASGLKTPRKSYFWGMIKIY